MCGVLRHWNYYHLIQFCFLPAGYSGKGGGLTHRYLMTRLSLPVTSCIVDSAPLILWWSNLEILSAPLHRSSPFIGGLRCQAIQTEHGLYIAERTQKAVYIVRCLWSYRSVSVVEFFCRIIFVFPRNAGIIVYDAWVDYLRQFLCFHWHRRIVTMKPR
jgi:hypothetical protein